MWDTPWQPVIIAVLVVVEVAVWQVRVAMAARGRKRTAAALGAVNAVLTVVAIGQVVTNLDRPANIAGYAFGVAAGVYLGVLVDGRFAGDPVEYRVLVPGEGAGTTRALLDGGWDVMVLRSCGPDGTASLLSIVVNPGRTSQLERDLDRFAPGAVRSSVRLRSLSSAPLLPPPPITAGARLQRTTAGNP